MHMHDAIVLSV